MWTSLNVDNACKTMNIMCAECTFNDYVRIRHTHPLFARNSVRVVIKNFVAVTSCWSICLKVR